MRNLLIFRLWQDFTIYTQYLCFAHTYILYAVDILLVLEVIQIPLHKPIKNELEAVGITKQMIFDNNSILDIENIALTDLISIEELQQIQNVCADAFGIASIITTLDGQPITQPSNFCKVCELVRATELGRQNCMRSAQFIGNKAHELLEPTYEKCLSCGFIDASAPIIVAGEHIANWVFGQIRNSDVKEEDIRLYATEIGLCPDELAAALSQTHIMPLNQFNNCIRLIWMMAQKLSTLAYNNLRLSNDNMNLLLAEQAIKQLNKDLENRIWEYEAANNELQETLASLQETQAQLIQQEKMASLGSLVAGIAHEINTPLGVGVTAASYLDQQTKLAEQLFATGMIKKSDFEKYLTASSDAANIILLNLRRASELINSFKRVAADRVSENRQIFNFKNYLGAIILSLRPNLKKSNHNLLIECDEFIEIDSYPGAFSQIITNLVMNSLIHAYPDGRQGNIKIDAKIVSNQFILTYSDDGAGISESNLDKIFEPFFTTRRGKGGTGLGLNILFNLVTQTLQGNIKCQSSVGQGSSFIITVPIVNGGTP
ncbi:sensor histidine kinase [Dendrosporobacter sp. 1207_IL3150]|uniref:sensor histidine kinase n=1 Tax=Dendrosporobacter sp. 1207_IL3150 TaxID=3084054 RepID=UPI002FDB4F07